tara:strand:+ start:67 stop:369 length:303 start_codon:yes stop_codon:yes gene_type:complete
MNNFKEKWGIRSNFQLFIILIVFSITGFIAGFIIADPLLSLFHITNNDYYYWPIRILLIFPSYQILILFVGGLFGQFRFFWEFEKKMLSRIGIKYFNNKQ